MPTSLATLLLATFAALVWAGAAAPAAHPAAAPAYTPDGRLTLPADYRRWVFLSSGFDMSYRPGAGTDGHHMFGNVFADPRSYAAFERTGHWPDKSMLVLESREARQRGSINRSGQFQTGVMGIEIHVLDRARFGGGWAFFTFDPAAGSGTHIPAAASCYACHSAHGAVDTTFVQFYPTLLPLARRHGTLRPADRGLPGR